MEEIDSVLTPIFDVAYNQKNITNDISMDVLSIAYTDYKSGSSDEIEIDIADIDGKWLNEWYPDKGDSITVKMGYVGQPYLHCGTFEIDEVNYDEHDAKMTIRALATGQKLPLRTKNSMGFNLTTLADLAQFFAQKHGMQLVGQIEDIPLDRATQYNETDLYFLTRLAYEYGYAFKVTDNNTKLTFWHLNDLYQQAAVLVINKANRTNTLVNDTIKDVPKEVELHHHDPKTKKQVQHKAASKDLKVYGLNKGQIAVVEQSPSTSNDTHKIHSRTTHPKAAAAKVKAHHAKTIQNRTKLSFTCVGNTKLIAGVNVDLLELGKLSGRYNILKSTHNISRAGYTTMVELTRL